MKIKNKQIVYPSFNKHLKKELKDPEFKKYFDEYGKHLKLSKESPLLLNMS